MKPDLKLFPVPKKAEITEFCGGTDRMIEEIVDRSLPAEGYRLIIGSEGHGIARLTRENCDTIVSLPMVGRINSLNASVAGAILMYEVSRQRRNSSK